MSEMVDRVSAVIEAEFFKIEEIGTGRGIITPERIARVVIAAMREPTETMVDAGWDQIVEQTVYPKKTWQDMIDEALK